MHDTGGLPDRACIQLHLFIVDHRKVYDGTGPGSGFPAPTLHCPEMSPMIYRSFPPLHRELGILEHDFVDVRKER